MIRRQLSMALGVLLVGLIVYGLSVDLGSAGGDLEDQKLEAFIAAASAVDRVTATWQPKIAQATDQAEAQSFRDQANLEIRKSIEEVDGISLAEYRKIRETIVLDQDMRVRLSELMVRRP